MEQAGSAADILWIWSGGTFDLDPEFRSLVYTPAISYTDMTAIVDETFRKVNGYKDGNAVVNYLSQTDGTQILTACVEGEHGTLQWSEFGTIAHYIRHTMPAISLGVVTNNPYNDVTNYTIGFQQDGIRIEDTWPGVPIEVTITADIDTNTDLVSPDTNYGSSLTLTIRGDASIRAIGLIKLDLTSIPALATINAATLYLYGSGSGFSGTVNIYRVLPANSAWTEADTTWNYAVASSIRWAGDSGSDGGSDAGCSVSGTDYSSTEMGDIYIDSTSLGVETSATLDISEFNLMRQDNYGLALVDLTGAVLAKMPISSDYPTSAYHPKLVVNYTVLMD